MSTRRITYWTFSLAAFLGAYFLVFLLGFDKNEPSLDESFTKIKFHTSPRWVRFEIYNNGLTLLGRRATIWNYIFYPAERAWRFVRNEPLNPNN